MKEAVRAKLKELNKPYFSFLNWASGDEEVNE